MPEHVLTRERPILFSGSMVCAILHGVKTQTRRVVKPQPQPPASASTIFCHEVDTGYGFFSEDRDWACPFGGPGDHLWVRETWQCQYDEQHDGRLRLQYRADNAVRLSDPDSVLWETLGERPGWRSPMHMPRWASRIRLTVLNVRVERVQAITEQNAAAEGCLQRGRGVTEFRRFWRSMNDQRPGCSWNANPWVWVIRFRRRISRRHDAK